MILIDPRQGSGDLLDAISKRVNGQAMHASPMLDSGDVAWEGCGPDGDILIGVELKTLEDMLTSMRSGRYIDQLDRMREMYQIIYLMITGVWRPSVEGWIEVPSNGGWKALNISTRDQAKRGRRDCYMYSELDKFIASLELKRDVIVRRVPEFSRSSRLEVVTQLVDLYQWWQKPWDSHESVEHIKLQSGNAIAGRASVLRMFAAQIPGCGWELSRHIDKHFKSVEAFVGAGIEDLMAVKWQTKSGRKSGISVRLATEIYNSIRRETK